MHNSTEDPKGTTQHRGHPEHPADTANPALGRRATFWALLLFHSHLVRHRGEPDTAKSLQSARQPSSKAWKGHLPKGVHNDRHADGHHHMVLLGDKREKRETTA